MRVDADDIEGFKKKVGSLSPPLHLFGAAAARSRIFSAKTSYFKSGYSFWS